jgi:flavin reductase (DIM6/NTAB) family NADH-FMN oxidoreductase RutF
MHTFDPDLLPFSEVHRILLGGVAPRPIAFVSTLDKQGRSNLAPFSFFNAFGVNPPIICFSPAYAGRTGLPKHTFLNLLETGECTVSIVTYDMVFQTSLASSPFAAGVDEFAKAGFTKTQSIKVMPHGVAESPFVMEARLLQHIEFGGKPGSANMLICEVVLLHVKEEVFDEKGSIDPRKMDQVARMGGPWYSRANADLFQLPQPLKPLVGIDALPEELKHSSILTGSDLAKLATIETLPNWKPSADPFSANLRHLAAKSCLDRNDLEGAWKVLGK